MSRLPLRALVVAVLVSLGLAGTATPATPLTCSQGDSALFSLCSTLDTTEIIDLRGH